METEQEGVVWGRRREAFSYDKIVSNLFLNEFEAGKAYSEWLRLKGQSFSYNGLLIKRTNN